jgi:lysophospholipase L1-like esterase
VKRLLACLAAAVCALAIPAAAQASISSGATGPHVQPEYYLALGDSLSVGVQPTRAGVDVPTSVGYPNQFYWMVRNSHAYRDLRLAQLGCPGETTASMLNGGICGYSGDQRTSLTGDVGSQAAAALAFIAAHRGQVPLITIDLGANDLNPCLATGTISGIEACLPGVLSAAGRNLATVLGELRTADPTATILGMNYYDPELGEWLTGSTGQTFATGSVALTQAVNNTLSAVYADYQVPVADVATAFDTTDMTTQVTLPRIGTVPANVARICLLTWECVPPPQGPNEHANVLGYWVIALAFDAVFR